ncbi:MAG TPA: hypothetical protein VNK23_08740 [Candidatus Dormibacteraeota bacterium]|nr:hypothetical protein [Candidatus Dormibacteraeota bacterium]
MTPTSTRNSSDLLATPARRSRLGENGSDVQRIGAHVRITPQARRYALWELARRAGVSPELFRMWTIRHEPHGIVLEVSPSKRKQIFFPNASPELLRQLSGNEMPLVRKGWLCEPDSQIRALIPDFVVPFASGGKASEPLFSATSDDRIECTVDLLLVMLLVLSRWEESVATEHDNHGRFASKQSVAFKHGFLERPIVDEYGLACLIHES